MGGAAQCSKGAWRSTPVVALLLGPAAAAGVGRLAWLAGQVYGPAPLVPTLMLPHPCPRCSTHRQVSLKREAAGYDRPGLGGSRRTFNKEFATARHPGVAPFTALQGGTARRLSLRLPQDAQPSMRGQLITCTYFVKVGLGHGGVFENLRGGGPYQRAQGGCGH